MANWWEENAAKNYRDNRAGLAASQVPQSSGLAKGLLSDGGIDWSYRGGDGPDAFKFTEELSPKQWQTIGEAGFKVDDAGKGLFSDMQGKDWLGAGLAGAGLVTDFLSYGLEKDKTDAYINSLAEQTAYNKRMEANKKNIEGDFKRVDWSQ